MPNQHTISHNPPWRDEEVLRKLYWDKQLSAAQIGDRLGCDGSTVIKWLHKNNIRVRKSRSEKHPEQKTCKDGYVRIRTSMDGRSCNVLMHRLLAVAEYGFDDVKGRIVHHKNRIPWDNRPENIEVTTQSNHMRQHASNEELRNKLTKQDVKEIRRKYPDESTLTDLADKFDVSISAVYAAKSKNTFKWVD